MKVKIKYLGVTAYEPTWRAMQTFTANRTADTPDEIWVTQHPPVYTLGLNRKDIRLPLRQDIPVMEVDRGGKITYHGLGQAVVYVLVDLKRRGLQVRQLVTMLEQAIIQLLTTHGIEAKARTDAPGVYVQEKKIASLGLRLKNGCCYHGLSLNVNMDLTPFDAIDPCGYQGMQVTQLNDLGLSYSVEQASEVLVRLLASSIETSAYVKISV